MFLSDDRYIGGIHWFPLLIPPLNKIWFFNIISKSFIRDGSYDASIGGGVVPSYPPGEGQQNLQNWLNQSFFPFFFANLVQNGLNDTKMEFFSM